jgi:hypothetical protein
MITFETRAEVEASSTIPGGDDAIQVLGYVAAGDGGGALYRRAASEPPHAGKIEDANSDWWELAELVVNPLMFGCDPTGTADSSAAMNDFFLYCIDKSGTPTMAGQRTNAGHIPAGTYKIDWGTLVFDTAPSGSPASPERLAWPEITTDGAPDVTFVGTGSADAPMITLRNGVPTVAVDRCWTGGRLGALKIVPGSSNTGKTQRHGLSLLGVKYTQFDGIHCENTAGCAVFMPKLDIAGNPDPHNVAFCRFVAIYGFQITGTVLRNENSVGFNCCIVDFLAGVGVGDGGIWGLGAGNTINLMSYGASAGWAIHDGYDSSESTASPSRNHVMAAEIDGPENGICLNNSQQTTIEKIRINHRYQDGLGAFWPLTAILLGDEDGGVVRDTNVEVRHRIDSDAAFDLLDRPAQLAALGTFCDLGGNARLGHVVVYQSVQDNTVPPSPTPADFIPQDAFVSNANTSSRAKVWLRDHVRDALIFDGIPPRMASATYNAAGGGTLTITSNTLGTPQNGILALNNERFDPYGDYDPSAFNDSTNPGGYGFTAPYDGYAEVNINLVMTSTTATRLQLGVVRRRGGAYSLPAFRRHKHVADSTQQSYQFTQVIPVVKGDILYAGADQNSGASLTTTGIVGMDDIQFQVRMV